LPPAAIRGVEFFSQACHIGIRVFAGWVNGRAATRYLLDMADNHPSKRLTLWEIAELAGTSKSTVSRVVTNPSQVAPETRKLVEAVIEKHGYHPNLFARGLRGGRTGQIAVIGRWMERGFLAEVIKGVDTVASGEESHVLCCLAHSTEDYIHLWQRFAQGGQVDGIILVAPPMKLLAQQVGDREVPVVLCACHAPQSRKGWKNVDAVILDNARACRSLMEHLVEQGCRRFVHLEGTAETYDAQERRDCFTDFIKEHEGLEGVVLSDADWRGAARAKVAEYLKAQPRPPDAFVAFNDSIATGAIEGIRDCGFLVPKDIAVTGFDDSEIAEFAGLTTVHVPSSLIGEEATRLLIARMGSTAESRIARTTLIDLTQKIRTTSLLHKDTNPAPWPGGVSS